MTSNSYLQRLLTQVEPLAPDEVASLRDWLAVLRDDVAMFGATPEDETRMNAIKAKIGDR